MIEGKKKPKLKKEEIVLFCNQISIMLKAGIPLRDGLNAICEDLEEGKLKAIMEEITSYSDQNMPLSKCMEGSGAFPSYVIKMVEVGDLAGKLEKVMDSLASYYESSQAVSIRIRNAVIYPGLLFLMMSAVIAVLILKVLPIFEDVFLKLGGEMAVAPKAIMNFGIATGKFSLYIVSLVFVLIIALILFSRSKAGKSFFASFFAVFPLTKSLFLKMAARKFASSMALMLSSGMDVREALALAGSLLGNERLEKRVKECSLMISDGASVTDALSKTGIFPGLFSKMVKIGVKAGAMDTVMEKLAIHYEEEVDVKIANLTSAIEPVLIAGLSIVIGIILISVMLPLVSIMSNIG